MQVLMDCPVKVEVTEMTVSQSQSHAHTLTLGADRKALVGQRDGS